MLSNHEEFLTLIHGCGEQSLIDSEEYEITGFESLEDGGRYTLGQPQQQQQQQQ